MKLKFYIPAFALALASAAIYSSGFFNTSCFVKYLDHDYEIYLPRKEQYDLIREIHGDLSKINISNKSGEAIAAIQLTSKLLELFSVRHNKTFLNDFDVAVVTNIDEDNMDGYSFIYLVDRVIPALDFNDPRLYSTSNREYVVIYDYYGNPTLSKRISNGVVRSHSIEMTYLELLLKSKNC